VSVKFVSQMRFRVVADLIYNQSMTLAVQTEEYQDWLREELLGKEGGA